MLPYIVGTLLLTGVAALIFDSYCDDRDRACREYNDTVENYKNNIELLRNDIEKAKSKVLRHVYHDYFNELKGYYVASFKCADIAYEAKRKINEMIQSTYNAINETKENMNRLYNQTKDKTIPYAKRESIHQELASLKKLKTYLFEQLKDNKKERDNFLEKVHSFNNETHALKVFIRDNCGEGGKIWYDRLEERIAQKRLAERS